MRYCKMCKTEFEGKTNSVYCSKSCIKSGQHDRYNARKKVKICRYCEQEFLGSRQKMLCPECAATGKRKRNFKVVVKEVVCRKCKETIDTVERCETNKSSVIIGNTCSQCKENTSKKRSEYMKTDANPGVRQYGRNTKVKMTQEELSAFLSQRMSGDNNPMKKKEVQDKVRQSLIKLYAENPQRKVVGNKHWLWKGRRDRCQTIRTRLYPVWTRPILERDNFTCLRCGTKGGRLEVHHVEPFFDAIVDKVLNGREMHLLSEEEFEIVVLDVLECHKSAIGATYCVGCHKVVDKRRR